MQEMKFIQQSQYRLMGIYISKGNRGAKRQKSSKRGGYLAFLGLGGVRETAISSSKVRLTPNFSSYLLALFLGFLDLAVFAMI